MKREIMFHLGDPTCGIGSIKFVHCNSGRGEVSRKLGSMRTLVMGIFMVILIRWLLRRGRVLGTTHEVFKCDFEVFNVFDMGTLVLEGLNRQIDWDKVVIYILDVFLLLVVVNNQGIELLGSGGCHLEKWARKWYRGNTRGLEGSVGQLRRRVSNYRHNYD